MKNYQFILIFLFHLISCGYGQEIGNPDDTARIERPCPTYDLNCIRAFFQKHAHCKKTFGPVPEPIIRPQTIFYVPRINLTITIPNQELGGLNGRVEEFYLNRETDNLVIAVVFRNITQTNRQTYFKFHRRAKEPVVTEAFSIVIYDSVIITAVIPKIDDLQLHDAECTIFSNDDTTRFFIGPSVAESTDPQPAATVAALPANLPNNIQELFLTDSAYYIATYIQYNICDFGLFLT